MLHSASCGLQPSRLVPNRRFRPTESSPQVITEQTSIHWTEYQGPGEYGSGGKMDRSGAAKIKAVILDYGEVLSYPPPADEWNRMASVFHMDPGRFRPLWDRHRLAYDRGDLSLEAYWARLADDAGVAEADAVLQYKDWVAFQYAGEHDPVCAATVCMAGRI